MTSSIIDVTIGILSNMGLEATRVTTPPGYAGITVLLPNGSQAVVFWSKIDEGDLILSIDSIAFAGQQFARSVNFEDLLNWQIFKNEVLISSTICTEL